MSIDSIEIRENTINFSIAYLFVDFDDFHGTLRVPPTKVDQWMSFFKEKLIRQISNKCHYGFVFEVGFDFAVCSTVGGLRGSLRTSPPLLGSSSESLEILEYFWNLGSSLDHC